MATYVLQITGPDNQTRTVELTKRSALIGRKDCEVIVEDPRCSSEHAQLIFDGRQLRIRDLGSTNGTFFEGKRITEMLWPVHGELSIGKYKLTLQGIRGMSGTILQTAVAPPSGRSTRPRAGMILGVCVGIAELFRVNVTFVRATFCVLAFADGLGILAYLLVWALMTRKREEPAANDAVPARLTAIREHPAVTYSVGIIGIVATLARSGGELADIVENGRKIIHIFGPDPVSANTGTDGSWSGPSDAQPEPVREEIRRAMHDADQAMIRAFAKQQNPGVLAGYYAEPMLGQLMNGLQTAFSDGSIEDHRLEQQTIHAIAVAPDGQRARMHVTQTWSSSGRSIQDGSCRWRVPSHELPQTVTLVRGGVSGWRVASAEFEASSPERGSCSVY
jgi:phage shock protein PspC (stress-responsive transcriptional regulator)